MGTRQNQGWLRLPVLLTFALLGACGDDDEAAPGGINLDAGLGADAGSQIDGGGTLLDATIGADTGTGADAGSTDNCKGANDCYSCKPTTNVQLLNSCYEGCQPFDNTKRLPGYEPGKLPPLP